MSTFVSGTLRRRLLVGALLPFAFVLSIGAAMAADKPVVAPPPVLNESAKPGGGAETAVLAGGCFWGVQAVFQHVKGVNKVVSGYAGGTKDQAQYEIVSSGHTGHAEAVEITFDPSVVSYGTLLQVYFSVAHDPTQLDRQGPDVGPQYRSEIFARDAEQKRVAQAYIAQLGKAGTFGKPIATKVGDLPAFYTAEAYHQDYATLHPNEMYIVFHDRPKIENLKRLFPDLVRDKPVLVTAAAAK